MGALREQALLRLLQVNRNRLPHQTTYKRVLAEFDIDEWEQVRVTILRVS